MANKRIAITSNYDDEMYTETFLQVPVMTEHLAKGICRKLNNIHPNSRDYYKPVAIDYVLYEFQP